MWLRDCSEAEKLTLHAISVLADMLPRPMTDYVDALGESNRVFFKTLKHPASHNPSPGSLAQAHHISASPRYGA